MANPERKKERKEEEKNFTNYFESVTCDLLGSKSIR
jgi:hypothetical protein